MFRKEKEGMRGCRIVCYERNCVKQGSEGTLWVWWWNLQMAVELFCIIFDVWEKNQYLYIFQIIIIYSQL